MTAHWPQSVYERGVAFFVPSLEYGGAERSTVDLANTFASQGLPVHLLVNDGNGPYRARVESGVSVIDLQTQRTLNSIAPIVSYLKEYKPAAFISALDHANVVSLLATRLSGVPVKTIVTLRIALSEMHVDTAGRKSRSLPLLMRLFYPHADAVVAVSQGVADDYAKLIGIPRDQLEVIYNPVISERTLTAAQAPLSHPWFAPGEPPVLLSVGRLSATKDFPTLMRAFAIVRQRQRCRLLILGDGELRMELEALARTLKLNDDFAMPGFANNPYAYMARASVYVLSSRAEGLPGALIEAMACGAPVVATDCPSGPQEILQGGVFGPLIPTRNPAALAEAITATLQHPIEASVLRKRAMQFSDKIALEQYRQLLTRLIPDA